MENTNDFKILVVDDIPELLDITSRPLKKANYQVFSAANGAECIEVLKKEKPDIILLDVMLPDVNGKDLSRAIKSNAEFSSIYIILISSVKTLSEHAAEGLEDGADGYIARPVDKRELLARVEAACRIIKAERDLADKFRKNWETTFAGTKEAIFLLDDKGIIQQANKSATVLFEKNRDNLIGNLCCDIVNCKIDHTDSCPLVKMIESKKRESEIFKFGEKWIEETVDPILDNDCNVIGSVNMIIDFTEREELNKELSLVKEKAEESNQLKVAFLHNISHEVRTPMNGILGFSSLLKEPGFTGEQQKEFIRIIEESGYRMLNTINDIVEISKIETGVVELSYSEVNTNELLHEIYTSFKLHTDKKGLIFTLTNTFHDNEFRFLTDVEKVQAVLSYLIGNAIKFTQNGNIEFGCKLIAVHKRAAIEEVMIKPDELEFFVKDTGIGIPENRHQAIFDRFVHADIEDKAAMQGSGLGLSISKAYVELLGGKIWLESVVGKGSTFYFSIPVRDFRFNTNVEN